MNVVYTEELDLYKKDGKQGYSSFGAKVKFFLWMKAIIIEFTRFLGLKQIPIKGE